MAEALPPEPKPETLIRLRYRSSMDEIVGAVDEVVSISRSALRRDAGEEGAEFFWHLRPDTTGRGTDTEVLSHFVVPETSRRPPSFWVEHGLTELGVRIHNFLRRSPQRSLQTMSDPHLHTESTETSLTLPSSYFERPVARGVTPRPATRVPEGVARSAPVVRSVRSVRSQLHSPRADSRPTAEASGMGEVVESLRKVLDRLSPQSDEAVIRLVHLRDTLRKMSGLLNDGSDFPSLCAAAADLVGGGMGLTIKELEDLRLGLRAMNDPATWPEAIARLRRVTGSLGGEKYV